VPNGRGCGRLCSPILPCWNVFDASANPIFPIRTPSDTTSGCTMSADALPDWEKVLSAAAHLQRLIPSAVLVGGTAAATHVKHRFSRDADHVVPDLTARFDLVLAELESVSGWVTARVNRPVQILGSLDGIETGVRQLIRKAPLETMTIEEAGHRVVIPTLAEMLRIKAALILKRNATRDYLDFAAMADRIGDVQAAAALSRLDALYPQPSGESALQQLQVQLASPMPFDLDRINLREYKELSDRWQNWQTVQDVCARVAVAVFDHTAGDNTPD
jgi:hypothetical protein